MECRGTTQETVAVFAHHNLSATILHRARLASAALLDYRLITVPEMAVVHPLFLSITRALTATTRHALLGQAR
jgi:hypothetical protein